MDGVEMYPFTSRHSQVMELKQVWPSSAVFLFRKRKGCKAIIQFLFLFEIFEILFGIVSSPTADDWQLEAKGLETGSCIYCDFKGIFRITKFTDSHSIAFFLLSLQKLNLNSPMISLIKYCHLHRIIHNSYTYIPQFGLHLTKGLLHLKIGHEFDSVRKKHRHIKLSSHILEYIKFK
jgi:hypothetical protein